MTARRIKYEVDFKSGDDPAAEAIALARFVGELVRAGAGSIVVNGGSRPWPPGAEPEQRLPYNVYDANRRRGATP